MEKLCSIILYLIASTVIFAEADNNLSVCDYGQFKLPGMKQCHAWLRCSDLKDFKFSESLGAGSTKVVRKAYWNGQEVAVSQLYITDYEDDFHHGLEMLQKFSLNPHVVQLVGYCRSSHIIITEYHKLGNATTILSLLDQKYGSQNIIVRLKLCLNYAQVLDFLHTNQCGTRVMCDSNDLEKLLSQMLITDDFKLILSDLDALPLVEEHPQGKIKCGSRELHGDFVAPEQKWPFSGPFRDAAMPGYDEKTDIWKAGDVFKYFVSSINMDQDWVQYRLFNLIKSCKNKDPRSRPTATYIVSVLEKILAELSLLKTEL